MRVAIVGHEAAKFTPETELQARSIIREILARPSVTTVVSGKCHLGGVDIYAAEEGRALGLYVREYPPSRLAWKPRDGAIGFYARNLQIAGDCDEAHCVVVRELPEDYQGMRFKGCYHCGGFRPEHVKSGGCWTVIQAGERGAKTFWHVVP